MEQAQSGDPAFIKNLKLGSNKKFVEYFNNYLEHIGLHKGCNWVFNISKNHCLVRGLNVKTGNVQETKSLTLYNNLTHRERPVLEVNNMIINTINEKSLIACQLFNFNFCFNLEDIMDSFVYSEMCNSNIYISIVAKIDGETLEVRDIFSNHEYIEKLCAHTPSIVLNNNNIAVEYEKSNMNVFDYLRDYDCIDLVDKNKILQNTCHWALSAAQNQLFNLYDGFSLIQFRNDATGKVPVQLPYYDHEIANIKLKEIDTNIQYAPYWCNNYLIRVISARYYTRLE